MQFKFDMYKNISTFYVMTNSLEKRILINMIQFLNWEALVNLLKMKLERLT